MVDRVSTAGVNLTNLLSMQEAKSLMDTVTNRLTTGRQWQRYQDYGTDAKRIVDYQNMINEHTGYIRSIQLVEPITSSYDEVLSRLADVATNLMRAADPMTVEREDFPGETAGLAESWMVEIESNLNVEIGGRYIFAGSNFTEAPVKDLRTLADYSVYDIDDAQGLIDSGLAPTGFYTVPELDENGNLQYDSFGDIIVGDPIELGTPDALESADIVPQSTYKRPLIDSNTGDPVYDASGNIVLQETVQSYHEKFAGDQTEDSRAWDQMSLTASEGSAYFYGITAVEEGFQNLIEAALRLRSATQEDLDPNNENNNWDRQRNLLREAYNLADAARDQIRQLEVRNATTINFFSESVDFHDRFISLSQIAQDDMRNADQNESAILLSALNGQMEASYNAIAKRNQLSLTNFLN